MPSSITHELIAESAGSLLPTKIRAWIDAAPDYYYLGAQGPDLFFFYRPLAKRNLGKKLHRGKLYLWFRALADCLQDRTGDELAKCRAYALGFCSHLEGDVAFHPFVYAFLEETGGKKRIHQRIENDWDVYFLSLLKSREARGYDFPFDLAKISREGVLYEYVRDAAAKLGEPPIGRSSFKRALLIFKWYLLHFHRRRGRYLLPFLPHLYPAQTPTPGILSGERFSHRAGGRGESADELFLFAAQESAARIQEFAQSLENGNPLPRSFSRHLLTGEAM